MDIDINKVLIVGSVEEIGELRTFPSGSTLCPLTIVTVQRFSGREGDMTERKQWHKVTIWGERGKRAHDELSRGVRVLVEGRLNRRSYERDGETRWFTDIVADKCIALGQVHSQPRHSSGAGFGGGSQAYSPPHQAPPAQPQTPSQNSTPPASDEAPPLPPGEDDLPF